MLNKFAIPAKRGPKRAETGPNGAKIGPEWAKRGFNRAKRDPENRQRRPPDTVLKVGKLPKWVKKGPRNGLLGARQMGFEKPCTGFGGNEALTAGKLFFAY